MPVPPLGQGESGLSHKAPLGVAPMPSSSLVAIQVGCLTSTLGSRRRSPAHSGSPVIALPCFTQRCCRRLPLQSTSSATRKGLLYRKGTSLSPPNRPIAPKRGSWSEQHQALNSVPRPTLDLLHDPGLWIFFLPMTSGEK